uniref:Uncharacterized protein n=1 Tax=Rhizophora mucronata TaxID=61149 RepID=A0A2P2Q4M4_RHIMU
MFRKLATKINSLSSSLLRVFRNSALYLSLTSCEADLPRNSTCFLQYSMVTARGALETLRSGIGGLSSEYAPAAASLSS